MAAGATCEGTDRMRGATDTALTGLADGQRTANVIVGAAWQAACHTCTISTAGSSGKCMRCGDCLSDSGGACSSILDDATVTAVRAALPSVSPVRLRPGIGSTRRHWWMD